MSRRSGLAKEVFAFDRASVRSTDVDGRLRITKTPISKANVCGYMGYDIPNGRELGLDDNRLYKLYRDPAELAKAAPSFNHVQLLLKHMPVSSDDHQKDIVVGALGTDGKFEYPYLYNSMIVWAKEGIDGVETGRQRQLSSSYRYKADMTPGRSPDGEAYDGVMRDIIGNHVALVREGRAGPDVMVGDSKERFVMATKLPLFAAALQVGLATYLQPKLAKDSKIDLRPMVEGVTAKNYGEKRPGIAAALKTATTGHLAKDMDLEDALPILEALEEVLPDAEEQAAAAAVGEPVVEDDGNGALRSYLASKGLSEADIAEACALLAGDPVLDAKPEPAAKSPAPKPGVAGDKGKANDSKGEPMKDAVTKVAMDAAIKVAVDSVHAQHKAIREAEEAVRPYVGVLVAMDSAEAVYRAALKILDVKNVDTVHASALPTILAMQPKPGARPSVATQSGALAADAAAIDSYGKMFPDAMRIRTI